MSKNEIQFALTFADLEKAIAAERRRCREQEVEPLLEALRRAVDVFDNQCLEREANDIDEAIAALEKVQKENS
jgi:hypothetical protein